MFKKLSFFISTSLRQKLNAYPGRPEANPTVQWLLRLPLDMIARPGLELSHEERISYAKRVGGPAWKFVDGVHAESVWLQDACRTAQRIEVSLRLLTDNYVQFQMVFFSKNCTGSKPTFRLDLGIDLSRREIVSFGCIS